MFPRPPCPGDSGGLACHPCRHRSWGCSHGGGPRKALPCPGTKPWRMRSHIYKGWWSARTGNRFLLELVSSPPFSPGSTRYQQGRSVDPANRPSPPHVSFPPDTPLRVSSQLSPVERNTRRGSHRAVSGRLSTGKGATNGQPIPPSNSGQIRETGPRTSRSRPEQDLNVFIMETM